MKYVELSDTLPKISRISLGTLYLSSGQKQLFDLAFDNGINFFDTSDSYNNGESDLILQAFLQGKPREHIVLSSKVFFPTGFGNTNGGLSKAHIFDSVEGSLQRLNTDYLDILYLHRFDAKTPLSETMDALASLLASGKIKHWGFSAFGTKEVEQTWHASVSAGIQKPLVAQYAYNLYNRNIENEVGQIIEKWQVQVVGYYTLAQGVLTGKYTSANHLPTGSRATNDEAKKYMWDFTEAKLLQAQRFSDFCATIGHPPASVAIAWCLVNKNVAAALTHVSSGHQLEQNLQACHIHFTDAQLAELNHIFVAGKN